MKKNDLAAIIIIIAISSVVAYFLADTIIGKPENAPVQVEEVKPITGTFAQPDNRIFNDQAFDPTVDIDSSGQPTNQPFGN